MSNRKTECYEDVFRFIEEKVFKLEPAEFITDFELAMRKAISKCFKGTTLRGCWFHYCTALRKNALRLGMDSLFKKSSTARLIYHQLMSLPLLPPDEILRGHDYVIKKAKSEGLYEQFRALFKYFSSQWLVEVLLCI